LAAIRAYFRAKERFDKNQMASGVKAEFLHAWTGVQDILLGHDDLKPTRNLQAIGMAGRILMTPGIRSIHCI